MVRTFQLWWKSLSQAVLTETGSGLYKTELIHQCALWKSRQDLEMASMKWVVWFNNQRLLETIGYITTSNLQQKRLK